MTKIRIILFFFLLASTNALGQDDPTGSISVIGGGSVPFFVNSLKKWENGVTLENWTRIRIRFNDPPPTTTTTGWKLDVKPETAQIDAESGTDFLDLNLIHIRVISVAPTAITDPAYTGVAPPPPVDVALDAGWVDLITDNQNSNVDLIVTISYDLGITIPLLGYNPNYYYVDLRFRLTSY